MANELTIEALVVMKLSVKHVMAFISGVLLMSLASLILSGYGSWPTSVAGYEIFPLPDTTSSFESDSTGIQQSERSVSIQTDGRLTVTYRLETSPGESVVSDVVAGKFRDAPEAFIGIYFGGLTVSDGGENDVRFRWTTPTVQRTGNDNAVITAAGESRPTNGRLELRADWAGCVDAQCGIGVEVTGSKRLVAVDPPSGISKQSDTSVELQSQSSHLSLTFDQGAFPEQTKVLFPARSVWSALESMWRLVLLFAPWIFAYQWLRSRAARGDGMGYRVQGAVAAFRPLLMGAVVIAAVLAINRLQALVQELENILRNKMIQQVPGSEWLPNTFPETVAAVVGLLALWSWRNRPVNIPLVSVWAGTTKFLILLLGAAALGLSGYSAMTMMQTGHPAWVVGIVAPVAGLLLAVTGTVVVSRLLSSRSGWVFDGLCAAALVLTIALVSTVYSHHAAALSGVLTFLVLVGFLMTLIWTIINTLNTRVSRGRRVGAWTQAAVLVFAMAFVIPPEVSRYMLFPLSPYDAVRISFASEPFLRVGLIVSGIVLLCVMATRQFGGGLWRPVSIGAVALLVLRPESNVVGIPLSFTVGLLLTATILVRPRREISYPSRGGDADDVRHLLHKLRAHRMGRELKLALRKRIQTDELPIGESDKIASAVARVMDAPTSPPTMGQRHAALGWGGMRSPMRRAWMGAAVTTFVGVLFSIPLLSASFSGLDLRGSNDSVTFLTTILTFRFPLYGFVFGYFLPLLHGSSGLAKATRFFVVLGTSEAIAVLIPYNPSDDLRGALTVLLVQLAMMCGILGVGADLMTLRQANEGIEHLADLYNMSRLALWSTGVAASAATALITALLGAALTTATQSLLPPTPPPIVQPQNPASTEQAP